MDSTIQSLLQAVQTAAAGVNATSITETTRVSLLDAVTKLGVALQKPEDTLTKLAFSYTQFLAIRILVDLDVFRLLSEANGPITAKELSEKTGADEILLERLLRVLVAAGVVGEADAATYLATPETQALTQRGPIGMVQTIWDIGNTTITKMPEYFRQNGYKNPSDQYDGPFQYAFQVKGGVFDWLATHPEEALKANAFFEGDRGSRPNWIDWFPVKAMLLDTTPQPLSSDTTVLVDVAGGRGHDILSFRKKFPELPGKYVLHDLPHVIADNSLELDPVIEKIPFNFFENQPAPGARLYFMKFIFHDWSDNLCLKILDNIKPAMTKGYSKLIIEDFIIPDKGCSLLPAMWDLEMMAFLSAIERSRTMWLKLLDAAGFEVEGFYPPPGDGTGIIVTSLKA